MARRAVARVTRRPRKPSPPSSAAVGEDGATEETRPQAPAKRSCRAGGFFCCYLLRSTCPRLKGRTYIGFTVNPRRRIRQHNGEISSGAWRTRKGRPWEMVLCIYGFPTNVAALQFEWAWQHPKESLAVRQAAAGFKSLSGTGNKVKLAYAMLNLPSWENLNLTVNFFSSASNKFAAGCQPLPSQMKTVVCPMEDLQYHAGAIREEQGPSSEENDINEGAEDNEVQLMDTQTRTAADDMEEDNYSSDDFDLVERDGILDLTEPARPRTSSQCSQSSTSDDGPSSQEDNVIEDHQARQGPPHCHRGDSHLEHSWKQPSIDQVQQNDVQTSTAVYDVEDNYSSDEFVPMERDGILDLTEPDGSRTWLHYSLRSDGDGDGVVEDEVGHVSSLWKVSTSSANSGDDGVVNDKLRPTSPLWKVCAGSDGKVFEDELGRAASPVWNGCAGSDGGAVNHELGQASPVMKIGTYSDCGNSGVTVDELGQASQTMVVDARSEECGRELGQASRTMMVDAGSEEGGRDLVVDLVTPTPVGRLRRTAGTGSICHRIIDLTASPVVIEL